MSTDSPVTLDDEIKLAQLSKYFEAIGSPSAGAIDDLYCRLIYTDRGPEPTRGEIDLAISEYAPGLEWNADRLEWQIHRALLHAN